MPYYIKPSADMKDIREWEMGLGDEIKFSTFTSCIGIIGYQEDEFAGASVLGIHLGMYSDGELFAASAVDKICQLLTDCKSLTIVGCVTMWSKDTANLVTPYKVLISNLKNQKKTVIEINTGDGIHGGKLKDKGIEIYCKNGYYPPEKLSAHYISQK